VEGALGADDAPVAIEFGRVLTEIRDVAAAVLGVVVGRPLLEDIVEIEPILNNARRRTVDDDGASAGATTSSAALPSLVPV
jgi:hypothetical protein